MSFDLQDGIVRILKPNGQIAGTGFVLTADGLIATCSHVIQGKQSQKEGGIRPQKVSIVFHATGDKQTALVEPQWWLPWNAGDLAIIRAEGILPQGVQPLPLGSAMGTSGHEVSTFGFPGGVQRGLGGDGKVVSILRMADRSTLQLRSGEITVGFSGAPIWDKLGHRVIGMVSDITEPDKYDRLRETAIAVATETLRDVCSVLQLSEVCPYHGLAAFTEADAEFFFGRQTVVEGFLGRLQRYPRFLMVLGPSGSGKSSVIQAGLIPQLRKGKVPGSDRWGIMVTRPATQPFHELIKQDLIDESYDLLKGVELWLRQYTGQERLVLIIDQFEELLSTCPEGVRQDFITQLVNLLHAPLPITVVLIMRDDFYSRFTQQEELVKWLERSGGPAHVPKKLTSEEFILIVQKPAEAVGLKWEEGLIETIVKDAMETDVESQDGRKVGRSSVLPLLEFAMTELWKQRRDGMLTHEAYRDIRGVAGALTLWADTAFFALPKDERPLAQRAFTDLVYLGDEDQGILDSRRRRTLTSLSRNGSEQEAIQAIIQHLVKRRLLVTDRDLKHSEETVEIIHDVLLREWTELRKWLETDRHFLLWHQELERRTHEWVATNTDDPAKRQRNLLLEGSDLTKAGKELKARPTDLSESECDFIQASKKQRTRITRRNLLLVIGGSIALIATSVQLEQVVNPTHTITKTQPPQKVYPPQPLPYSYTGHLNSVTSVAWSPDGKRIASADGDVQICDASSGTTLLTCTGGTYLGVNSVVWSPDGRHLASSSDETVRVWDANSGKLLYIYKGHTGVVNSITWSPDNKHIASAGWDETVQVWDASSRIRLFTCNSHPYGGVNSVAWSPDGKRIASSSDKTVQIWDASNGKLLLIYKGHIYNTLKVNSVAWSPNGKRIASGGDDNTVQVWDASSGIHLLTYKGHSDTVNSVAWSPDGKHIASGSGTPTMSYPITSNQDKTAQIWDASSGTLLFTYRGHADAVLCIAWSPNGQCLASASADDTMQVWPASSGTLLFTYTGHTDVVDKLAWSPNGERLASASDDRSVQVWDASNGTHVFTYTGHTAEVRSVAWSPDGGRLTSTSRDKTVQVWDVNSIGTHSLVYRGHTDEVVSAAWSPDGKRIASAGQDGTVQVWDASNGTHLFTYPDHNSAVYSVAWSPDGKRIASAGNDVQVWDVSSGIRLLTYTGHTGAVLSVDWSPDGRRIASASDDGTIQIWNASSGMHLLTYTGYNLINYSGNTYAVHDAAWSHDGKRIVSTGEDGTVQVWDASSGTHLFTYPGHMMIAGQKLPGITVFTVAWSPDGYRIASASDETVQVWFML